MFTRVTRSMDLCVLILLSCVFQFIHGQPDDRGALNLTLADFYV
jgi:hypothetical protein